jgi:cell division protein FtsA
LKERYGSGVVRTRDCRDRVWINGDPTISDRQFPKNTIEQITAARTREILEVVKKKLGPVFAAEKIAAGVVLTGGTAKLPGIDEAAAQVFGVRASLGEFAPDMEVCDELRDPGYSTVLGLLNYGLNAGDELAPILRRPRGFFKKFTDIFPNN